MSLNNFSRRFFAATAAAGDGQAHLHLEKRAGALVDDLADLSIADGMTQADVHGWTLTLARPTKIAVGVTTIGYHLNTNANDCQLMDWLTVSTATGVVDLTVGPVNAFTRS